MAGTNRQVQNRLEAIREELGLTVTKFAVLVEVHPGQIYRWASHTQEPSVETYWRLWQKLKQFHPDIHMENLMQPVLK